MSSNYQQKKFCSEVKFHKFQFKQTHKTAETNLLRNYEETCLVEHFTIAK